MSKAAAIDFAVRLQLAADQKTPPATYGEVMNAPPPGYNYDKTSLRTFLLNVSNRLQLDTPSLAFNWPTVDVEACLTCTVATLEMYIANATILKKVE